MAKSTFQTLITKFPNRADHVWKRCGDEFICVLCGGVTCRPPAFPTPEDWTPDRYEPLTEHLRKLSPNPNARTT